MDFRSFINLFLLLFLLQGDADCRGRSSSRGRSRGGSHSHSSGGSSSGKGFWSRLFGGSSSKSSSSSSHASSSGNAHSSSPAHTSSSSGTHSKAVPAPPYGFKSEYTIGHASGPVGPSSSYVVRPPPYTPHSSGIPPPPYNPAHNHAGYEAPPAYHQIYGSSSHLSARHDPQVISTVNLVYPRYHYSSRETGRDDLGFYLGYSLGRLNNPTYHSHSHYGYFDGYSPRYDHYQVHHYYHGRDQVPSTGVIEPDKVIECSGDSDTICPMGTYSLCTNNGVILCVTEETVPCLNETEQNCAKIMIPCITNECSGVKTVIVPCVSTANVTGSITVSNKNMIIKPTTTTTTTTTTEMPALPNTLKPWFSLKEIGIDSDNFHPSLRDTFLKLEMEANNLYRRGRSIDTNVNTLCTVALAVPAERNHTNQEEIVQKAGDTFLKILSRVHGLASIPTSTTTTRTTLSTESLNIENDNDSNWYPIGEVPTTIKDGGVDSRFTEKPATDTV